MKFGDHLRERRLALGLSLREFCANHAEDPSNWSKLERGLSQPPTNYERLYGIALHLQYLPDSQEMQDLFDLASWSRGELPRGIVENEQLMEKLPLVFRTFSTTPTEDDLMRLADIVREAHSADE